MTLDPDSIDEAIRKVEEVEELLKSAMVHLIGRLAEKGVEIARAELIFFGEPAYDTGALSESVRYDYTEDGNAVISAGQGLYTKYGSYAMFVEYGTGIIGAESPNPTAGEHGYAYDVKGHGKHGWYYPAPWGTYEAEDGTLLAWTQGMPPRPFMGNTFVDLQQEAEAAGGKIIAEYFKFRSHRG